MSWRKKLGLQIMAWIASALLAGELNEQEAEDLKYLRTKLSIAEEAV